MVFTKRRAFIRVVWVALALFLVACSSGKVVKTYEGDALPNEDLAVLTAGENIVLLSVNGRKVPEYLLTNISVDYGLKPGRNVVIFRYESVWSRPKRTKDESPSEKVQSQDREVELVVKPGDRLQFRFPAATNIREARALAETFDADLINQTGQMIARSGELVDRKVYQVAGAAVQEGATSSVASDLPPIEALKVLWSRTTKEDKKAFLKWAFE